MPDTPRDDRTPEELLSRYCDIVMKGGVTSGVVYPRAVTTLSEVFRFRNIGGTSAGAIAAACTAAAEYGRSRGRPAFAELAQIPDELGRDGRLATLFQPQAATRPLFDLVTAPLGGERPLRSRVGSVLLAIARHFPLLMAAGLGSGGATGWLAVRGAEGRPGLILAGVLGGVVLGLLAAALLVGFRILRFASHRLPANGFGLSRGYDRRESSANPGLVTWLDATLQRLAGRTADDLPLTFGDLWGTTWGRDLPPSGRRQINLEMMTTNLTQGRPHRLPFEQHLFFFDPAEWGDYFPPRIVASLCEGSRRTGLGARRTADGREVLPLPCGHDFPVVVAARMSLSFPLLISAVPVYMVNYSRPAPERQLPERCWLSDGGICSNFPVHFFDSLIPRRPTFAINLRPFTADYPRQEEEAGNVYMARTNGDGSAAWWTHFDVDERHGRPRPGLAALAGFLGTAIETAMNWRDNAQIAMTGFRDRVVHVKLDESREGGLNLQMPGAVITRLADRGQAAGELILRRYGRRSPEPGVVVSWPNHRWVRYRNAMAMLQHTMEEMDQALRWRGDGDPTWEVLVRRGPDEPPPSYRWSKSQTAAGPWPATTLLQDLIATWKDRQMNFRDGAPSPYPELRATPRV